MIDIPMIDMPFCHKCCDAILEDKEYPVGGIAKDLVGCKVNDKIKSYGDACELCPLLSKNNRQFIAICMDDEGVYKQTTRRRFTSKQEAKERIKAYDPSRKALVVNVPPVELDEKGYPIKVV
jgi:hypothetical protein